MKNAQADAEAPSTSASPSSDAASQIADGAICAGAPAVPGRSQAEAQAERWVADALASGGLSRERAVALGRVLDDARIREVLAEGARTLKRSERICTQSGRCDWIWASRRMSSVTGPTTFAVKKFLRPILLVLTQLFQDFCAIAVHP